MNKKFAGLILFYTLSYVLLYRFYLYILNPDGTALIAIAKQYAQGNWQNAINGYWGPLFSWLLSVILLLKVDPLIAVKILSYGIGMGGLFGLRILLGQFIKDELWQNLILLASVPFFLSAGLLGITSDLLLTVTLLFYLGIILQKNYQFKLKFGILAGILGALAYFAKSYAFVFFPIHFFITNLFLYFSVEKQKQKQTILKNFLLGTLTFMAIAGTWSIIISQKYQRFTFSTAAAYNYAVVNPYKTGHPLDIRGFLPLPYPAALSSWEDPSNLSVIHWSPWKSLKNMEYQIRVIMHSTAVTIYFFQTFCAAVIAIVFFYLLYLLSKKDRSIISVKHRIILVSFFIFPAGYFIINVEDRYLWFSYLLLFVMGGYLSSLLLHSNFLGKLAKKFLMIFFVGVMSINFLMLLKHNVNNGLDFYQLGRILANEYRINNSNIASNSEWNGSLSLSYFTHSHYYGKNVVDITYKDLIKDLKKYHINYYFAWNDVMPADFTDQRELRKIGYIKTYRLTVYKVE